MLQRTLAEEETEILKHSALNLNRELPECWDETSIQTGQGSIKKSATDLAEAYEGLRCHSYGLRGIALPRIYLGCRFTLA